MERRRISLDDVPGGGPGASATVAAPGEEGPTLRGRTLPTRVTVEGEDPPAPRRRGRDEQDLMEYWAALGPIGVRAGRWGLAHARSLEDRLAASDEGGEGAGEGEVSAPGSVVTGTAEGENLPATVHLEVDCLLGAAGLVDPDGAPGGGTAASPARLAGGLAELGRLLSENPGREDDPWWGSGLPSLRLRTQAVAMGAARRDPSVCRELTTTEPHGFGAGSFRLSLPGPWAVEEAGVVVRVAPGGSLGGDAGTEGADGTDVSASPAGAVAPPSEEVMILEVFDAAGGDLGAEIDRWLALRSATAGAASAGSVGNTAGGNTAGGDTAGGDTGLATASSTVTTDTSTPAAGPVDDTYPGTEATTTEGETSVVVGSVEFVEGVDGSTALDGSRPVRVASFVVRDVRLVAVDPADPSVLAQQTTDTRVTFADPGSGPMLVIQQAAPPVSSGSGDATAATAASRQERASVYDLWVVLAGLTSE